ncbi:hypothetical protein, partial [Escherichia coli]|uniref:hypothetical protein n=1 Tax=Escherichia coli TaxID=562 RepID=UPI001BC8A0D4
ADRNRSHWSTSKTPSYTKSVSWQHHPGGKCYLAIIAPARFLLRFLRYLAFVVGKFAIFLT